MDLDWLRSAEGKLRVSAAVFDDVLSHVVLAVFTAVARTVSLPDLAGMRLLVGKIAAFFLIAVAIDRFVFPWIGRLIERAKIAEFELSMLLIAVLAYAVLAELLGMHFILGPFVAGILFSRDIASSEAFERVQDQVSGITSGFLAPIFFASIGLSVSFGVIIEAPFFLILLIAVAFVGKLAGTGIPVLWNGFGTRAALAVGVGMSARGTVELIITDVALRSGVLSTGNSKSPIVENLFSAVVIMAVVTTLAAPIVLRRIMK